MTSDEQFVEVVAAAFDRIVAAKMAIAEARIAVARMAIAFNDACSNDSQDEPPDFDVPGDDFGS